MQKSTISYFPALYIDELIHSGTARFLEQMKFPIRGNVIRDLFGYSSYKAVFDLPSHLDNFVNRFIAGCSLPSVDELIDWHSLYPFYAPFLPLDRLKKLRRDMLGNAGLAARLRAGIMASKVPLMREMQICPQCVTSDRRRFGETYWHRSHQIPGVKVCYAHEIPLKKIKNDLNEDRFVSAEQALSESKWVDATIIKNDKNIISTLAKDTHWLLTHPELKTGSQFLYKQYKSLLEEQGFAKKFGHEVFTNKLMKSFKEYYPCKFLADLHCELDNHVDKNWLVRLTQIPGDATQHPLHHLLLMRFLDQSPEQIFCKKEVTGPFGKGPWPCLNPASNHFRSPAVDNCRIHLSNKIKDRPIGIFTCRKCGFSYSRYGQDKKPGDRLHFNRIIHVGKVWEDYLTRLWKNRKISVKVISSKLGIREKFLHMQANRLGLYLRGENLKNKIIRKDNRHNKILNGRAYRNKWIQCIVQEHTNSIRKLQKRGGKFYSWLFRHDKVWLMNHPRRQRKYFVQKGIVNWHKRDLQLSKAIIETVARIKHSPEPPKRITPTRIFAQMGVSRSRLAAMRKGKLPISVKTLSEIVETKNI